MSDDSETSDGLRIELSPTHAEMLPGASPVEVTVTVHNLSRVVEQCTIDLVGLDPDWFTSPSRSVALFPGDSERLSLTLHVPARDGLRAGEYPFGVVARSRSSGAEWRVEGMLVIPGEAAYEMDIVPRRQVVRGRGRFRVRLTNAGRADGELQLDASDAENGVAFEFHQDQRWVVPANTTIEVPFDAVPRQRPWVGPPRTYDVQVTARRPGNVAEVRNVHAQLVFQPRFASLGLLRRIAFLAGLVVALLVALSALPSELRCQLVRENGSLPILGRDCGATALGAPAAQPTAAGAPTLVAVGGGGGAAATPTLAAGQQAAGVGDAQAIGGGGGAAGAGMTAEGVPTPVPPAATAAAVFMAGVDATQAAAATAVATPTLSATAGGTPRPATQQAVSPTPVPKPVAAQAASPVPSPRPTATTVVLAQFQPGTCSTVQQPTASPVPTRVPPAKPSAVPSAQARRPGNDWSQSDPTAWWYCTGVTGDQLAQLLKTNLARLVDLEVEQAQPTLLFSAVAVSNQGAYARDWWWYYGLDDQQVQERLASNTARPIALKAYDAGGGMTRFAVVMVSNKPPDTTNYWWFPDLTQAQQIEHLRLVNQARLVDVDPYGDGRDRRYAVIMLANPGADQQTPWWLDNVTTDQIAAEVTRTGGHVIDIEPNDVGAGTFDVILDPCPCARNWWAAGLDDAGLTSALAQTHGRITSLATYSVQGQRRFAVSLIDNS